MDALAEFIKEQMQARGWTQTDLVKASGLSKGRISALILGQRHRMIADHTIAGLAKAFEVDQAVIRVKAAEAFGVPVGAQVVVTVPRKPTRAELLVFLTEELLGQSEPAATPNRTVGNVAGSGGEVSGETGTRGDLRDPSRHSHGSESLDDDSLQNRYAV